MSEKEQQSEMKEDVLISEKERQNEAQCFEGAAKWEERRCTYFPPTHPVGSLDFLVLEKHIGLAVSGKEWQEDVLINLWFTCLKIGLRNFSILDTYIAASKLEVWIFLCKII